MQPIDRNPPESIIEASRIPGVRTIVQLHVNGETRAVHEEMSLADLLERSELAPQRVAVEVNRELVRRADYADTQLREGDRIEIVTFVGGG